MTDDNTLLFLKKNRTYRYTFNARNDCTLCITFDYDSYVHFFFLLFPHSGHTYILSDLFVFAAFTFFLLFSFLIRHYKS